MNHLAAYPVIVPLVAACVQLVLYRSSHGQRRVGYAALVLNVLLVSWLAVIVHQEGPQVVQFGEYARPFAILFEADRLGTGLLWVALVVSTIVVIHAAGTLDQWRERHGFHPTVQITLAGTAGAFLTGDLFNLFVWFEVLLIGSFVLLSLGGKRRQLSGVFRYAVINLLGSVVFLTAAGLTYAWLGTLEMAEIAVRAGLVGGSVPILIAGMLLFTFTLKAAAFPLFSWLPDAYPAPPPVIAALLSGLMTKAGAFALIRLSDYLLPATEGFWNPTLIWLGAATMLVGVLGAMGQSEIRRLLSFHIVSQMGYVIFAVGLATALGILAAVLMLAHNMVAKSGLFLVSGLIQQESGTTELPRLGGLANRQPALAAAFAGCALALAGIPPLSGFAAKLAVIQAGFLAAQGVATGVAISVSLFTLLSMLKIWQDAFWRPAADVPRPGPVSRRGVLAALSLALLTTVGGLAAGPVTDFFADASAEEVPR